MIADPTRRSILDRLRVAATDVNGLVQALQISQPLVSKHLKVLRDAGVVRAEVVGQRRVYRLDADPLPEVLAWVTPYYRTWSDSLDRLEAALNNRDEQNTHDKQPEEQ